MSKVVLEHWADKINVVDTVRGGISDDAKSTLARVLENTNRSLGDLRIITNESVTPSSNVTHNDWFPDHIINMVSAIYASQIIDDLVSVQSIDSPLGIVRFLQYVYGDNRGNVAKGGVAIDDWGAMVGADRGDFVARELVKDESANTITDHTIHVFAQNLPVRTDPDSFVEFNLTDTDTHIRCKKVNGAWEAFKVESNGNISQVSGLTHMSVDYDSGEIIARSDEHSDLFPDNTEVTVSYFQDLEHTPTDSMNIELRIRTEMIKAVPHKIRANFAFDASYALSKAHGINVEESLVNACTAEIRQERDNEVIGILMRQAGSKSSWDRRVPTYVAQHEHDLSFISEIFSCASKINFETKRGFGNWVVVGRQGLNIIKSAGKDHFTPAGASLPNNGAFVVGEIEGQIKVIYSPYIPQDAYLVGYKGSDMDAGFIVADFLPITKTELVMLDDFVGRQGLVSYYGTKMLNPKMYVAGKILNGEISQARPVA